MSMKAALESLKSRLAGLKIHNPEPSPWPPDEEKDSLQWCCYQRLGRPVEQMDSMALYLAAAEKVWSETGDLDELPDM
jgi:hypothetical protein